MKNGKVNWEEAKDIKDKIEDLVKTLGLSWIDLDSVYVFRSTNSKARAYARTWGFPSIWQKALGVKGAYCIEVLSENFDKLKESQKEEILIHELCHIPTNFSGSLLPHIRKRGKRNFHDRVKNLVSAYAKIKSNESYNSSR